MDLSQRITNLILAACICMLLHGCGFFSALLPVQRLQPGIVLYPTAQDDFIRIHTDVPDVYLHYLRYEGTGENIVLLHGFSSSTFTWEDMVSRLRMQYMRSSRPAPRIWALDMKGFGWSDKPARAHYDPLTLSREVSDWMDRLGIDNATVAGNSFGGAVAILLARDHPKKIKRLVLVDSGGYPVRSKDAEKYPNKIITSLAARIFFSRELVKNTLEGMFYDPSRVTEARVDAYYNRLRTLGSLNSQLLLAGFMYPEAAKRYEVDLGAVRQETLIVWGRQDKVNPLHYGCCFKQALPRATLAIIEQCGHMPQEEKPAETADLLFKFLHHLPLQTQTCPCD